MSDIQLFIVHFIEFVALVAGIFYTLRYREDKISRYFVCFLLFVVLVETFGLLPKLITRLDSLSSLENSFFSDDNYWLYNPYLILNFLFYIYYYLKYIKSKRSKLFLKILTAFFFVSAISNLALTDVYFDAISSYTIIFGGILTFMSIFLYFYEVFKSDTILYFGKLLPFYVAAGTLVFHLSVTPLLIYSKYYSASSNPEFVKIYTDIITIANFFMYTCFTIGFIICSKKNKSYS